MLTYKYPASIVYEIYLIDKDKRYQLFEDGTRTELTQIEYLRNMQKNRETNQQSMQFYDYQILTLRDKWDQAPALIEADKLQFYYDYGLFTEEQYMHLYYLHTHYKGSAQGE